MFGKLVIGSPSEHEDGQVPVAQDGKGMLLIHLLFPVLNFPT